MANICKDHHEIATKIITEILEVDIIGTGDEDKFTETYEIDFLDGNRVEVEHIFRDDWENLYDTCPECNGTEFDHMRYEGGHYGHHEDAVIQRNDYWDQKGSLYTVCRSCDEILYKSPAYDVLEAVATGTFEDLIDRGTDG